MEAAPLFFSVISNAQVLTINSDLEKCYEKIYSLIKAEINNGSKDYDKDYIRKHVEKLTS